MGETEEMVKSEVKEGSPMPRCAPRRSYASELSTKKESCMFPRAWSCAQSYKDCCKLQSGLTLKHCQMIHPEVKTIYLHLKSPVSPHDVNIPPAV